MSNLPLLRMVDPRTAEPYAATAFRSDFPTVAETGSRLQVQPVLSGHGGRLVIDCRDIDPLADLEREGNDDAND
jgi:hypothetical protein